MARPVSGRAGLPKMAKSPAVQSGPPLSFYAERDFRTGQGLCIFHQNPTGWTGPACCLPALYLLYIYYHSTTPQSLT